MTIFKILKYIQTYTPYYKDINENDIFHALDMSNFKTTKFIVTKDIRDIDYST
jgi:hypothetical protein